jgi:probable HAF family extracellular repeat protein
MLTVTAVPAAAATTYTITDLGSGVSDVLAINATGEVTGYSYTGATVPTSGCCGNCYCGKPKPCVAHIYHAFAYGNDTLTDLGTLGRNYGRGKAINGSGQISGTCGPDPGLHACLDRNGTITQLPNPSNFTPINCGASAINNGQIADGCDDTSSYEHAVLWQNGAATDPGTFGGPQANAAAINGLGQIAGWAQTNSEADHGFLYSNGKMTDLGLNFFPAAVNDSSVIVGGDLIYSGGTLQNLNSLIPAGSPYRVQYGNAVNDPGQIVADAYNTATSQGHALLLNPG